MWRLTKRNRAQSAGLWPMPEGRVGIAPAGWRKQALRWRFVPKREHLSQSLRAALPVMLGYLVIGIPCGVLSASIGMNAAQVLLLSVLFYSGAGQFMIPNMWAAANPIASIVASVSLVNTRQILYGVSLARHCQTTDKPLTYLFAASVTDESFGVNTQQFAKRDWSVGRATMVNLFSQSSWTASCVAGVFVGNALNIPLPIASFAMTSIFICLLLMQHLSFGNVLAALVAATGVVVAKLVGLGGAAILIGALLGVAGAMAAVSLKQEGRR